jgi:hypothetical protein
MQLIGQLSGTESLLLYRFVGFDNSKKVHPEGLNKAASN